MAKMEKRESPSPVRSSDMEDSTLEQMGYEQGA